MSEKETHASVLCVLKFTSCIPARKVIVLRHQKSLQSRYKEDL